MNSQAFRKIKALAAVAGLAIVAGACGEVAGVDDGLGEVQVTLQEATAEALFQVMTAELAAAPEAAAGRVDRGTVESLNITVNGIQILPYCEDAGEQNGDGQCEDLWETLNLLEAEYDLDLVQLPLEDEPALVLTEETLVPIGEYHKVRLFISEATVKFNSVVTVGHSTFSAYDADDPLTIYPVEIPSAQNTGIKADIELSVAEDTDGPVSLLFDADATFRNVIATGSGRVKMPPVLKARPMYQNQNQDGS